MRFYGPFNSGVAVGADNRAVASATSPFRLSGAVHAVYVQYNILASESASQSRSPSASISTSPSNSPSRSISPSQSYSPSASPSPSSPASTVDVYLRTQGTGSGAIPSYDVLVLGNEIVDGWYLPRSMACTSSGALLEQGANKTAVYSQIPVYDYLTLTVEHACAGDSVTVWVMLDERTKQ